MTYEAPEIRYTDRDVREDSNLRAIAERYVENYGGEFEPLVNAKNELSETGALTTSSARRVLNCMRHDNRVAQQMPRPKRPTFDLIGDPPPRRRQRMNQPDWPCISAEPHYSHSYQIDEDNGYVRCPGIPYAINRDYYERPARIKRPFVAARSATGLLHRTTGEGFMVWYPPRHEYGFGYGSPTLLVKTACKETTRHLKNPILLEKIPEGEMDWRARCTQGCFDG